jgi:putative endonuclease
MLNRKKFYVYLLASEKNGTLYIGVTSNLSRRVQEHKKGLVDGFTKKYRVSKLVYYEIYGEVGMAIYREKQLKKWKRDWKLNLIEKENPSRKDLFFELL